MLTFIILDRHDRVLGDLEEGIRGERDEDQQTKNPNSWTLTLNRITAKKESRLRS